MTSRLLTAAEAADHLGVAQQTLAHWRLNGRGPSFVKVGRKVAYSQVELDAFVAARTFSSTSEYPV